MSSCVCVTRGAGIRRPDVYTKYSLSPCNGLDRCGHTQVVASSGFGAGKFVGNCPNPTSSGMTHSSSSDFDLGSGNFTIECFVKMTNLGTTGGIISRFQDTSNIWDMMWHYTQGYCFSIKYGGTWIYDKITGLSGYTTGVWYHICAMRASGTIYFFINGVVNQSAACSTTISGYTVILQVARYADSYFLSGFIDECKMSIGVARYPTTGFTPPTRRK